MSAFTRTQVGVAYAVETSFVIGVVVNSQIPNAMYIIIPAVFFVALLIDLEERGVFE